MRFLPLIWASLWRKPLRTCFMFISVTVAFVLFGLLHGITQGMNSLVDRLDANRIRTQSQSRGSQLPLAYAAQIAQLSGVASVTPTAFFGGFYQELRNPIGAMALGGNVPLERMKELSIAPQDVDAFKRTRVGAVIGRKLADKYGWKIGEKVPLTSNWRQRDGSNIWTFEIVGIYDIPSLPEMAQQFWLHYEYLDEARVRLKGTASSFLIYTNDADQNERISATIDQMFVNSSAPTLTQSEREWQRAAWNQVLDVSLLANSLIAGSLFTLLFLTGNTMMQSVRERTQELGVLRACGFPIPLVIGMVLLEAIVLCVLSALAGLGIAKLLFPMVANTVELSEITMPLQVLAVGVGIAVVAGIASAAIPVFKVSRLSVVEALAHRA